MAGWMAASSHGSLAGEGPPGIERLRQAVDAGVREPAAAECVPALSWIASMRPNGSGAASSRAARARASAPAARLLALL